MCRSKRGEVVRAHRRLKVRLSLLDKQARLGSASTTKDRVGSGGAFGQRLSSALEGRHVGRNVRNGLARIKAHSLDQCSNLPRLPWSPLGASPRNGYR